MSHRIWHPVNALTALLTIGSIALIGLLASSPSPKPAIGKTSQVEGDVEIRRLTPDQYRNIIADVFGDSIKIGGHFEPGVREQGLLAVGASTTSITASSFEQYDAMARSIAAQVVDPRNRISLIACTPKAVDRPDDVCAKSFLAAAGRLLYRRPLTDAELGQQISIASSSAQSQKDFYAGLATSLSTMLIAPQFLFREEMTEADPDHPGKWRLTGYAKASRLSFLLWNTAPDDALLRAAGNGELETRKGVAEQVDRMLRSSRIEDGVRAFFADMLEFDGFDTLAKDATIYPKYTDEVTEQAREQLLRTITEVLITENGDYRDLFTTKTTFMTPLLASIYQVPLPGTSPWQRYTFPNDRPTAGILTDIGFTALHSHPGRSSPTLRGRAIRQELLCQKVPDPPANVNFSLLQDTANPNFKTARDRVKAHTSVAICAGCHKLTDPIGLALETFDTTGQGRKTENGVTIDTTGELNGVSYSDAAGLGQAVHDDPSTPACLVSRWYSYMMGHRLAPANNEQVGELEKRFKEDGYRIVPLMRAIAIDDRSYRAPAPEAVVAESNTTEFAAR